MESTSKEIKSGYKVGAWVKGIKRRCRNVDNHRFTVSDFAPITGYKDALPIIGLIEVAKGLVETNMKDVRSNIVIYFDYVEKGDFMETWEPFRRDSKHFQIVLDGVTKQIIAKDIVNCTERIAFEF